MSFGKASEVKPEAKKANHSAPPPAVEESNGDPVRAALKRLLTSLPHDIVGVPNLTPAKLTEYHAARAAAQAALNS